MSHERFRADLRRAIDLLLAGRRDEARAHAAAPDTFEMRSMPPLAIKDLAGIPLSADALRGRVVLVEFWATWCAPCRGTLAWLGDIKRRYGGRIEVVAIAVESDEAEVRKLAGEPGTPLRWVMGTPEVARAFGDLAGLPTLFVFDADGKGVATFFGATPTLHTDVDATLVPLLSR